MRPTAPRRRVAPLRSPSVSTVFPAITTIGRLKTLVEGRVRTLIMVSLFAAAVVLRCSGLGTYGFSEDEIQKVRAVEAYRQLDFTANAEHPMVMKVAIALSMGAADAWNGAAATAGLEVVPPEVALRLPNALAGAVTTVLIFLLAESLFGLPVAAWAAFLWAVDVNAIALNRLGKEDTFLVFFLMLAAWFYQKGKDVGAADVAAAQPWYNASGAAFGLMLASKYMPYYFGLHALFVRAAHPGPSLNCPRKSRFYLWMAVAFLAANPAILLPANLAHVLGYVQGATVLHTGYVVAGDIYTNTAAATPWGMPVWFYAAFLGTKVPLVVLLAAALGLVPLVARRAERGFVLLRVFLFFVLVPYSLVASKFARYLLPALVMLDLLAACGIVWTLERLDRRARVGMRWNAAAAALVVSLAASPVLASVGSAPFYSAHQNAIGALMGPPGWLCPTDEFYDAGVREMVAAVSAVAGPGAVVASDATFVVSEYLRREGRPDLQPWSLARHGLPIDGTETWVIVQEGHRYFENEGIIWQVRARGLRVREFRIKGGVAAELYRWR